MFIKSRAKPWHHYFLSFVRRMPPVSFNRNDHIKQVIPQSSEYFCQPRFCSGIKYLNHLCVTLGRSFCPLKIYSEWIIRRRWWGCIVQCTHHCHLHHSPQSLTRKHPFFYTRGEKKIKNLHRNQPLFIPSHTHSAAPPQTWFWEHTEKQENPNEGNHWVVQPSEPEKQPHIRFLKRKGSTKPHSGHLAVHQNLCLVSLHNTNSVCRSTEPHQTANKTLEHSYKIMCKQTWEVRGEQEDKEQQ